MKIEVKNLCRDFGERRILSDVSFAVGAGERLMLVGPNGAGKTTLLRVLSCFLPVTSGTVRIDGWDTATDSLEARAHIGYLPEAIPLYGDMTPREFLRFRGLTRGMSGRPLHLRIEAVIADCLLGEFRHALIRTLSQGQRVRVALADALLHDPSVLLLDDPFASMDMGARECLVRLLQQTCADKGLIMTTHLPDEAAPLCTHYALLAHGTFLAHASLPSAPTSSLQHLFATRFANNPH